MEAGMIIMMAIALTAILALWCRGQDHGGRNP
jgi:hypothetical protein